MLREGCALHRSEVSNYYQNNLFMK